MLLRLENSYNSMAASMRELERIANNLANSNTVGYRKTRFFTEVLNEEIDADGSPRSARSLQQWNDQSAAELQRTDSALDVAIDGEGFFVISDPETGETSYTRAGQFVLDNDSTIRTINGMLVEGTNGPIDIPQETTTIDIRKNGEVLADGQPVGAIRVVQFENPDNLTQFQDASFLPGDQIPEDMEDPQLMQGHLEMSNVNVVNAMVELVQHSRLYEMQTKALRTTDLYLQRVGRDLSRF
ncbi:MAG: flagellar hook-basal body protein [Rhodothermaceae bacterium]|nr:flagellar hook-basal body protein [Rhodothermaceae bacterium]